MVQDPRYGCGDDSTDPNHSDEPDKNNPDADPFHPPSIPTLVHCLHCHEEYDSFRIEYRIEQTQSGDQIGFWCCPIEGCEGKGFGFDILPVDGEWVDPDGRDMGWDLDDDQDDDLANTSDDGTDDGGLMDWDFEDDSDDWWKNPDDDEDLPF